ncbi:colicin release lysis protein [Klebsiella pneumoniae]
MAPSSSSELTGIAVQ